MRCLCKKCDFVFHPVFIFKAISTLAASYHQRVVEEETKSLEALALANVGKIDPKNHLRADVAELMGSNVVQCLGTMLDTVVF